MPELIQDPFEDPAEPFSSALTPEDNSCDAVSKTAPSEAFSIDQWCYCDHHRTVDIQDSQNTEAKNMEPSNQVYPGLLVSFRHDAKHVVSMWAFANLLFSARSRPIKQ